DGVGVSGINQNKLVAGVDQPFVEGGRRHFFVGDKGVLQQFAGAFRVAGEIFGRKRGRAIVEDRDFKRADLQSVDTRRLCADRGFFGASGQYREKRGTGGSEPEGTSSEFHLKPPLMKEYRARPSGFVRTLRVMR